MSSTEISLSDDLLVEILTKLPLKSLYRFKCVSKSWQILISDEYFRSELPLVVSGVLLQRSNSADRKDDLRYISSSNHAFKSTTLNFFTYSHSNSTLIDCCNGLLLFYSSPTATYHVCNPTTRRSISLPKPAKQSKISTIAFDPYHSRHFKIVNFTNWHEQGASLELFDSQSGNWVQHRVHWGLNSSELSATIRYSNGFLYLLAHPNLAVAVNLDGMGCTQIKLPEDTRYGSCVGDRGGRGLHYIVANGNQLRVWMLRDKEKGEWKLKNCVRSDEMGKCRVVALHPKREVVYLLMSDQKIVAFNVCEERVEGVWELGEEEKGCFLGVCVFSFTRFMEDSLTCGQNGS